MFKERLMNGLEAKKSCKWVEISWGLGNERGEFGFGDGGGIVLVEGEERNVACWN